MNDKKCFSDDELAKIAGGIHITSEAVSNYVTVLRKRPGILDRLRLFELNDEDEQVILSYFASLDYFAAFCKYADSRNVEQLLKDAVD